MSKNRILSLIVAAIDLIYGTELYRGAKHWPQMPSVFGFFLFLLFLVIFALALIWGTDNMTRMVDNSLEPPFNPLFYNTWRNLSPDYLKVAGWVLLAIFIPAGAWISCQIGK
jgi:hypothetical protein